MDKFQVAHEWYMKHSESPSFMHTEIEQAWQYADAMQAEADKRKEKGFPEVLNSTNSSQLEWQPDWSQAPDGFDWFCVGGCSGIGFFCNIEPKIVKDHYWLVGENEKQIHNHGYYGDWRNSLRKRPQ